MCARVGTAASTVRYPLCRAGFQIWRQQGLHCHRRTSASGQPLNTILARLASLLTAQDPSTTRAASSARRGHWRWQNPPPRIDAIPAAVVSEAAFVRKGAVRRRPWHLGLCLGWLICHLLPGACLGLCCAGNA